MTEEQARQLKAMFDGLTGIHNRRWLDETLHRMVRRQQQGRGELSLSLELVSCTLCLPSQLDIQM